MAILIVGLILFLGPHSLKMAAPGWRQGVIDRRGVGPVKGLVALSSLAGIVLIVWGYASADFVFVYAPPQWGAAVCAIVMIPALVLAIASGAPPGYIKRAVLNPLLLATILWAGGHLLALGDLASLLLFGAFLLWSVVNWIMQSKGASIPAPAGRSDLIAVGVGLGLYALLVWHLHGWLFAVIPPLL